MKKMNNKPRQQLLQFYFFLYSCKNEKPARIHFDSLTKDLTTWIKWNYDHGLLDRFSLPLLFANIRPSIWLQSANYQTRKINVI